MCQGELKQLYYHKSTFGAPEGVQDEGFKLFINAAWLQWNIQTTILKDSDNSESLFYRFNDLFYCMIV